MGYGVQGSCELYSGLRAPALIYRQCMGINCTSPGRILWPLECLEWFSIVISIYLSIHPLAEDLFFPLVHCKLTDTEVELILSAQAELIAG